MKIMENNKMAVLQGHNGAPQWDIHQAKIDADGVEGFYWPLARNSIMEFNNTSIDAYADLINKIEGAAAIPYLAFGKYYLCEIAALYRALWLQKKCQEESVTPYIPENWLYFPYIWQGKDLPENTFLKFFSLKEKKYSSFKKKFHPLRILNLIRKIKPNFRGLSVDGLRVLPITKERLNNNIIATQRSGLIIQQAAAEEKQVIFCRSDRWFKAVSDEELYFSCKKADKIAEENIYKIFSDLCDEKEIDVSVGVEKYLKDFIHRGSAYLRVHCERLQDQAEEGMLPKTIWTGTAGYIWDLLLRIYVVKNGGVAHAHDHGAASGLTGTYAIPFLELWGCHKFITYSAYHAQMLDDLRRSSSFFNFIIPTIEGPKERKQQKFNLGSSRRIKTIMIISTIYDRDRGRMGEVPAEIVKVDCQARMIAKLISWGYDVIFKAHPESPVRPPKAFEELGARIEYEPFSDVFDQADLFLFDFSYTSTFSEALRTNIPIVVYDAEHVPWNKAALPELTKRLELVQGYYDSDNRAQVDWDLLKNAIQNAPDKSGYKNFSAELLGCDWK